MSWRDVDKDWDAITGDARRFMGDARHLGEDLGRQAELASQEVVAAEYIATGSLLEWFAGGVEDTQSASVIAIRQWRYLFEDGLETLERLASVRNMTDLGALPGDHLQRRVDHVRQGWGETRDLGRRMTSRVCEPAKSVWKPFVDMVRKDWSR